MTTTPQDETVLREILDGWKDAVDRHEAKRVAGYFTEDAIFQGLHPYTVGRPGIAEYYDSQPIGLAAKYRILETRRFADDILLAYLHVDFSFTDRPTLGVKLSVLVRQTADGWAIAHYQVSKLDRSRLIRIVAPARLPLGTGPCPEENVARKMRSA